MGSYFDDHLICFLGDQYNCTFAIICRSYKLYTKPFLDCRHLLLSDQTNR